MRAPILTQKRAKALRREMTQPERSLWSLLRREQLGLRFRRQHPIGPFILDFYCSSAKLCVEVDGPAHAGQAEHDLRRDRWLGEQGIRVLRVTADDVEQRPVVVLASIKQAAAPSTA
jgi:very-short-patch-repair endonuclease